MTSTICVIIPYYQTSPEPLRRAITSVFNQSNVNTPNIIIVDDSSPIPAVDIINEYFLSQNSHITIIHQDNAGAASARNTGLDNQPPATEFTAFLDSDDEWTSDHLFNAISALNKGYDFYFSDHQRTEWTSSKFSQINLKLDLHTKINDDLELYQYLGNPLKNILMDHMIQTSSVVYNSTKIKSVRFPTELKLGEDEIFWIKAIKLSNKICFSKKIESVLGKGVNISQDNTFNSEKHCELLLQNCRYWKHIFHYIPIDNNIKYVKELRLKQLSDNIADVLIYRIKNKQDLPYNLIAKFTYHNPEWIFAFIKKIKIKFIEKLSTLKI